MPTLTEQLESLLTNDVTSSNFKDSAMKLVRQGANAFASSHSGTHPTLLHVLVLNNNSGANNQDIAELIRINPHVLSRADGVSRTALEALIDALDLGKVNFDEFKQSTMILARGGADITVSSNSSPFRTLLHILVRNNTSGANNQDIVDFVKLNPAVLTKKDGYGRTALQSLLHEKRNVSIQYVQNLLSNESLNLTDYNNATLLHTACRSGNLPVVQYLVNRNLSLMAITDSNETLIHYAVDSKNTCLLQWLIDTKQIDINARDTSGQTALHRAVEEDIDDVVQLLVKNGADITIQNNWGKRAYELAATRGNYNLIPYLFEPKTELLEKIKAMRDYGEQSASKGQVAIALADELTLMAEKFFEQQPDLLDFTNFKNSFIEKLHSKDDEMSTYRIAWGTIGANIAIALTGIGLFLIAGKLIHSKVTEGRALFFFQKTETTSEEKIEDVQKTMDNINQMPKK